MKRDVRAMYDVIVTTMLTISFTVTSQHGHVDGVSITCSEASTLCNSDVTCRVMLDVFSQACDQSGKNILTAILLRRMWLLLQRFV